MPAYNSATSPSSIDAGDVSNVWATADGNLTSGAKTQRVALVQRSDGGATKLAWRVAFSGAPGVISLQLQTSDFDNDVDYQSEGSAVTTVGNNNEVRAEFTLIAARFARLLATTVTNAVTASVDFVG
ncbi:MAG TPA: hypothetical protein VJN64_09000 [Terriglobales bacterium]|nr:hypothetical protein [Terriglobales bacterium]